jgi:hypothetical protein
MKYLITYYHNSPEDHMFATVIIKAEDFESWWTGRGDKIAILLFERIGDPVVTVSDIRSASKKAN